jgi:hypothetical protein
MRNHLVRERPLGHAEMTRMETIVLAAGWSTALVDLFKHSTSFAKAGWKARRSSRCEAVGDALL